MQNIIDLIVFTPGTEIEYGNAIRDQISIAAQKNNLAINIETWQDGNFFGPDNRYFLNECIRKLHSYDGAILILGPQVRPTGEWKRDAIDEVSRFMRKQFGLPEQVAPNVLIEIGAAMTRFGRNRVFLLEPNSKSIEIPSYFAENNAIFLHYNDSVDDYNMAVGESADIIVGKLKDLGSSVFFSDLPSFGLAHGYLNALIRPALKNIRDGALVEIQGKEKSFSDLNIVIGYVRNEIFGRDKANARLDEIGLLNASIKPIDGGRSIGIRTLPDAFDHDILYIFDLPVNLVPSVHAINNIENLWAGSQTDENYVSTLQQRELRNYTRYLNVLMGEYNSSVSDQKYQLGPNQVEFMELGSLQDLSLFGVEQFFGFSRP